MESALPDLSTTVGSLRLPTPILTASGTAGHGAELGAFVDLGSLGAVVVKSLAAFPWDGNPPVRVHQTPSGMINSVGLQGSGVSQWLVSELPELEAAGARVVASIWGRSIDDYAEAAEQLAKASASVVAVEVNISCPNTEAGNELFAHSPTMTEEVLAVTATAGRPRWAKLSPNVGPGLPAIAEAAALGGAEAVTLVNTFFGLSIDPITRRPRLGGGAGGVSGPAIHPLAVRAVHLVHQAIPDLPIVAAGGVATVEDVIEFALVGASAIEVGTATFADPRACGRLTTDLDRWCAKQGIDCFADLIGEARF
ncbi:MAG: dihydroorotate dehydrogenase (NAD+) catalytic subunit [Acidimicrobiales bacterium]|jgi:dihydroorotate dehydrogenase (NAD+) catalytic subunit